VENSPHLFYFARHKASRELQRKIPGATRRVLNMQLNQLEDHELISKKSMLSYRRELSIR